MSDLTEKQKMLAGESHYSRDPELVKDKKHAISFLKSFNDIEDPYQIENELKNFLGAVGKNVKVGRDFDVTYGYNIFIGSDVSINHGCRFLDSGKITIGNGCFIGPDSHIYTASHPLDPEVRKNPTTRNTISTKSVIVEDNVWIGGNVTILPGVRIGENSVVGAGSVVTKDIPPNVIVAGNPAKIIRRLIPESGQAL